MTCYKHPVTEICTPRFGLPVKGIHGRNAPIKYIVMHQLPISTDDYDLEETRDIASTNFYSQYARSLHYIIAANGYLHSYVPESDVAWGMNGIDNPTIVDSLYDFENQAIHIGWAVGGQAPDGIQAMIDLVCCLSLEYSINPVNILASGHVYTPQNALITVPLQVIDGIQVCVAAGGVPTPPVFDPNACCNVLVGEINLLKLQVAALQASVADYFAWKPTVEARLSQIEADIIMLQTTQNANTDTVITLSNQYGRLKTDIDALRGCVLKLDPLCDCNCATDVCVTVQYRSANPLQVQLITPNSPVRVNFRSKVSDSIPSVVAPGPNWIAVWRCACDLSVSVNLRIASSVWCAGKKIWVDMVSSCGGRSRLAEYVSDGTQVPVTLTGTATILNAQGCTTYFEVGTNDLIGKTLEQSEVVLRCN